MDEREAEPPSEWPTRVTEGLVAESTARMAGVGDLPGCWPEKTGLLAGQPQIADPGIEGSRGYANLCK